MTAPSGRHAATVATVIEPAPTVGGHMCLQWVHLADHRRNLCCLPKGHRGTCLPFARFPRTEITEANPKYIPVPRSAS